VQGIRTIGSLLFLTYAALTTGIASAITVADGSAQPAGSVPFSLEGVVHVGGCSGALLWDRVHVLTAAHCSPATGRSTSVTFDTPAGTVTISGVATINPGWTGNVNGGNDLSIITLKSIAPVNGYQLYASSTNQITAPIPIEVAGFGLTGSGTTGATGAGGTLRVGTNTYDLIYGRIAGGPYLFDFDDGSSAHDAIGALFQIPNLGTGAYEAMIAAGDSGGPSFIDGKLAGIHSFIFSPGAPYDASQAINSSFGEVSGDTRLAATTYTRWINSIVGAPVPEPRTGVSLAAGLLALLAYARRSRRRLIG